MRTGDTMTSRLNPLTAFAELEMFAIRSLVTCKFRGPVVQLCVSVASDITRRTVNRKGGRKKLPQPGSVSVPGGG